MLKVTCPRNTLHEAVQTVSRGVTGRSTRPVQNDIYLEARAGRLRLVATDLEAISIEAWLDVEVADEGAVTAPSRVLTDLTGSLPEGDVTLTADENQALSVTCGGSFYTIRGRSAADFQMLPAIAEGLQLSLPQSQLHEVVRQTVFAASRDETRPILTGVLFTVSSGQLELVATDTYRLALRRATVSAQLDTARSAIVSARALHELLRVVSADSEEPLDLTLSDSQIECVVGNVKIASRLIEGQYPNVQKVIPESYERRVRVAVHDLQAALRRALIVARDDSNRVVFSLTPGMLHLRAESRDVGKVEEKLPAELEGEPLEIAFSARYLLDVLEALEVERVTIDLSGPLNPGIVRQENGENFLYVLMPMQII